MRENKMAKTRFDTKGIKSALSRLQFTENNFYKSITEFIWNGFDAKASVVELSYEIYQTRKDGNFRELKIKDNGSGISQQRLGKTFEPIYESEKIGDNGLEKNHSTIHGKNGVGRLTFFTFSNFAKWCTIYNEDGMNYKNEIEIDANKLNFFTGENRTLEQTNEETGTTVFFSRFLRLKNPSIENDLLNNLKNEFCWFLELNKSKGYRLIINGKDLDYSDMLEDREIFIIKHQSSGESFRVEYFRWTAKLKDEYSRFYYLDEKNNEIWKEYTKLNNQRDDFYHSIYISSEYFKSFNFSSKEDSPYKGLGGGRSDEIFKYFSNEIYKFLKSKRKPFLKKHSKKIVEEYKNEGIIIVDEKDPFELIQADELENVLREVYVIQPKFFAKSNNEQKSIFIGFLKLLLKSDEREQVLNIIASITELDSNERKELSEILKVTKLNRIVKTINLINDRYKTVEILKQLVFNKSLKANERDHLQTVVEENYWLFGEQYHLVSKDEGFQKALDEYTHLLDGEKTKPKFTGNNKTKRMDIFLCQRWKGTETIKNVIIELKRPTITLGSEELSQVHVYRETILNEPQFNSNVATWDFILIGNRFNNYIADHIKNAKVHGERSLVYNVNNFKIYVKTWSEIFDEFEIAHEFLNEKLKIDKKKVIGELASAEEGVNLSGLRD
jgi:hypothetical protein